MSEMMTAQELAGIREQIAEAKESGELGLWGDSTVAGLLATVDALTERAERDKADCETVHRLADEQIAALNDGCKELRQQRDEAIARLEGVKCGLQVEIAQKQAALAAKERAEGERDTLLSCEGRAVAVTKARIAQEKAEQGRDEALEYAKRCEAGRASAMALAETRGRALEIVKARLPLDGSKRNAELLEMVYETLSLTPPQALAQQREYVGALEAVAEAARVWHESCIDVPPHSNAEREASEEFQDALAALDAAKKGAPDA